MEEIQGTLITADRLAADFRQLGVQEGMTLLLHSSLKSLGQWVAGGPVAVILALEQVLGEDGTLVMPTQSSDLTDPSGWSRPPVPEAWWPEIREHMPAYDPDLTPIRGMGIIPDCFRKQRGVRRSSHPIDSFAAWGKHRDVIIDSHGLEYAFGERSPLARIYELGEACCCLAWTMGTIPRCISRSTGPIMQGSRRLSQVLRCWWMASGNGWSSVITTGIRMISLSLARTLTRRPGGLPRASLQHLRRSWSRSGRLSIMG